MLATLGVLAEPAAQTTATLQSIDWAHPSWDVFIYLFFFVAAILYGLSLGRDRIMVIMVSIYMALAVVKTVPESVVLPGNFVLNVSAFLGAFVIIIFLLARSALLRTIAGVDSKGAWWHVILFSILHIGLLISVTLSFLPEATINSLSQTTRSIFTDDLGRFIWVVAPILAMIVVRGGASTVKKYKYDV